MSKARRGEPLAVFEMDAAFHGGPAIKYQEQAQRLREQPGVWAKVIVASTPQAAWSHQANLIRGRKAAFRPVGEWEATAHGCDVWVRFMGSVGTG
jgi:hypothetical protein